MRVEMDVDTGAGGPGQEERASPLLLKVITADSTAGPGENGICRTSNSIIGINSSSSSSILAMSGKERGGEQIVLDMEVNLSFFLFRFLSIEFYVYTLSFSFSFFVLVVFTSLPSPLI